MATDEEWQSRLEEIERKAIEAKERGYVTVSLGESRGGHDDEIMLAVTPNYILVQLPDGEYFWRHNLEYDGCGHYDSDEDQPDEVEE